MADQEEPRDDRGTSRRGFLAGAAALGGVVVGGAGGYLIGNENGDGAPDADGEEAAQQAEQTTGEQDPGDLPGDKSPDDFVVHGTEPYTIETRRDRFGTSHLTAASLMFVRQNLPLPDDERIAERDDWSFEVAGVGDERELTVADLKRMGVETIHTVIQCSGNGRGFFDHETSGSQWRVGAAANVEWTGVPVSVVAEQLGGPAGGARFLTATGGEELPEGVDAREAVVERSVPIDKGMRDCLLAWEMNGEPTPTAHGGPLRLVVPGYYGINNVKFVKRLAFTPEESDASIMRTGYRVRPIGEDGAPDQPSMWEMDVKSFVTTPSGDEDVPAGPVRVFGVAFAGERTVERVEVSTDGGDSWEQADFYGPEPQGTGWRRFTHAFDASSGEEYVIASRATDDEGETQPEQRMENERGYGHNGWRDHAVTVRAA